MLLSLSRQRTLVYLDHLGEEYDADVIKWKQNILQYMESSKVFRIIQYYMIMIINIYIYVVYNYN